jgi:hypothetical protein
MVTLSFCSGPSGLWSLAASATRMLCVPDFSPWKLSLGAVVAMTGPSSNW